MYSILLSFLIIAFPLATKASEIIFGTDGRPLLPTGTLIETPLVPQFDWTMADRYGPTVDANDNGIVDLPNIREYVLNRPHVVNLGNGCACQSPNAAMCDEEPARFQVRFDASTSRPAAFEVVQKTKEQFNLEFQNLLKKTGKRPRAQFVTKPSPLPRPSFKWSIYNISDNAIVHRGEGPLTQACLVEGPHRIILNVKQGKTSETLVRTADIVDHLIVLLGDSFAAGEGAPERFYDFDVEIKGVPVAPITRDLDIVERLVGSPVQWADDGIRRAQRILIDGHQAEGPQSPVRTVTVRNAEPFRRDNIIVLEKDGTELRPLLPSERVRAEHLVSHRSSFTHASQFAIELEAASDKSSVTFINLAQTGATVKTGMLEPYSGATNEIDDYKMQMDPQIDQLRALVNGRSIDDLYLSIGGNDVGFAYLITALMAGSESENDFKQIMRMSETGDWANVGWDIVFGEALKNPDTGEFPTTTGFNNLGGAYAKLEARFDAMRNDGQLGGPVTLITPPFFGSSHKTGWQDLGEGVFAAERIERFGDTQALYCAENVDPHQEPNAFIGTVQTVISEFSPREFKWVDENIFPRLVATMKAIANQKETDWTVIEQGILPGRHGLCGTPAYPPVGFAPSHPVDYEAARQTGRRWYRSSDEAAAIQTGVEMTNLGMFHPNELGYAHVRELMKAQHPAMAIEYPGAPFADIDDSIVEVKDAPGFFAGSRSVTLASPQDVALLKTSVGVGRSVFFRINSSRGAPLVLHLFGENGALLASTSPAHQVDMNALRSVFEQFNGKGADDQLLVAMAPVQSHLANNIVSVLGEQSLQYKSDRQRTLYLAVSDARNVWFDPITGGGDDWSLTGSSGTVEVQFVE